MIIGIIVKSQNHGFIDIIQLINKIIKPVFNLLLISIFFIFEILPYVRMTSMRLVFLLVTIAFSELILTTICKQYNILRLKKHQYIQILEDWILCYLMKQRI